MENFLVSGRMGSLRVAKKLSHEKGKQGLVINIGGLPWRPRLRLQFLRLPP